MAAALEPASPAVPTAAADKQYYDDDDQKSCGVHTVLLIANECNPENQKGPSLVVPQNGLPSFYVADGTPINDLVKQWKRH